jgi:tRNA G18 (ribose-2'-O)-methylase SpoU
MKTIKISTKNAEYQIIEALKTNRQKRQSHREFFVEGTESIKQLLQSPFRLTRLIFRDYSALSSWARAVVDATTQAKRIEMAEVLFKELSDKTDPSELLVTVQKADFDLGSIAMNRESFVILFDRPSDLGNFGSVIRSANSLGVAAVFIVGHGIDCFDSKAIRSSLGAIFHTPIVQIESMAELIRWIDKWRKEIGLLVIGSDSTGEVAITDPRIRRPLALVLGNEAKGMSVALKEISDFIVSIPLSGQVNSLNVACAASILIWQINMNTKAALI